MTRLSRIVLAATAILCRVVSAAPADEAKIRRVIEEKLRGAKVESVQPGPLGLYEVHVISGEGARVVYINADGTQIFFGKIIDVKTDRDLTRERERKLNVMTFESLPLAQALKIKRGNGKRTLVMFADPYCPNCRLFEDTLQKIDNITVHVFMLPVIRPELANHSKAVWCSPDKAKAWLDLVLKHNPPTGSASCDNPVAKNIELARKLGVSGTPALFFSTGERVQGGLSASDLSKILDQAASANVVPKPK